MAVLDAECTEFEILQNRLAGEDATTFGHKRHTVGNQFVCWKAHQIDGRPIDGIQVHSAGSLGQHTRQCFEC